MCRCKGARLDWWIEMIREQKKNNEPNNQYLIYEKYVGTT